jgi:hypothetical protein
VDAIKRMLKIVAATTSFIVVLLLHFSNHSHYYKRHRNYGKQFNNYSVTKAAGLDLDFDNNIRIVYGGYSCSFKYFMSTIFSNNAIVPHISFFRLV